MALASESTKAKNSCGKFEEKEFKTLFCEQTPNGELCGAQCNDDYYPSGYFPSVKSVELHLEYGGKTNYYTIFHCKNSKWEQVTENTSYELNCQKGFICPVYSERL